MMGLPNLSLVHLWSPNISDNSVHVINGTHQPIDSPRHMVMPIITTIILFLAYGILCVISIFGNTIVCYVIFKNKRLHTATNFFIANLALSDLLVTFVNVPFNIARNVLVDWPFGQLPCHLVNYTLMLTSYVSTYTLTSIALDRHRVVLKPLTRRMTRKCAITVLVLIWVVAICLSLPYGIYMKVIKINFLVLKGHNRCRFIDPNPFANFERFLTLSTFVLQYCIPFALIAGAYGRIVQSLWARTHVGAVTANQQLSQAKAKRKSIKLLIAVVVVFAICWLPLNMYHLLTDLHPNPELFQYNSLVFFACHWIAISSTCYNPFVYCWLNESFREEVRARFTCLYRLKCLKKRKSYKNAQFKLGRRKLGLEKSDDRSDSPSESIMRNASSKRCDTVMAFDLIQDVPNSYLTLSEQLPRDSLVSDYEEESTRDLVLKISHKGVSTASFKIGSRGV